MQQRRPAVVLSPQIAAPLQQSGSTHAPFDPQTCPSGQQPGPHFRSAGHPVGAHTPPWHVPLGQAVPSGSVPLHLPFLRFLQGGQGFFFFLASTGSEARSGVRPTAARTPRPRRRDRPEVRRVVKASNCVPSIVLSPFTRDSRVVTIRRASGFGSSRTTHFQKSVVVDASGRHNFLPVINVKFSAGVGEGVQVMSGPLAGRPAIVIAWRLSRPRFTLGGAMDGELRLTLQILTEQADEQWIPAADVSGKSDAIHVSIDLPFLGGDEVIVLPSGIAGEIRGWVISGSRLETTVIYRVHLHRAPRGEVIEVDSRDLEARASCSA